MECKKVDFDSPWIEKIHALRQKELRDPLGLDLQDENLAGEEDELFFIASQKDTLLSCTQLRILDENTLKLRQMATAEIYKGMGLGKKLVEFAENWARENGYKKIELNARRAVKGFYKKLGYKIVGDEFTEVTIPHFKMTKEL